MPTFTPFRFSDGADLPMQVRVTGGWWGMKRYESAANWSRYRRPVGVNVWLTPDGRVGEGSTPPPGAIGSKCFVGGHVNHVTRYEAALLTQAGWGHCLSRAAAS